MSQLLTPREAAEMLGVRESTLNVWRHTKRYNLDYVKAGRLVRYRREDIQAFIASRTHNGGGADALRT